MNVDEIRKDLAGNHGISGFYNRSGFWDTYGELAYVRSTNRGFGADDYNMANNRCFKELFASDFPDGVFIEHGHAWAVDLEVVATLSDEDYSRLCEDLTAHGDYPLISDEELDAVREEWLMDFLRQNDTGDWPEEDVMMAIYETNLYVEYSECGAWLSNDDLKMAVDYLNEN